MKNILPSITTIYRFIDQSSERAEEGSFRFKELRVFLIKRNLPPYVWISEDATRITGKIQYDELTNKLIGFVMPLKDGCPQITTYEATSAKAIISGFSTGARANYAYVVMAQPLNDSAPSFCVSIYGTDSRFSNEDVINRWNIMKCLANKEGIEIIGFSSDGDPRLLKAMQINSYQVGSEAELNNPESTINSSRFIAEKLPTSIKQNEFNPIYIQDTVHIGTKLRTRFLKPSIILPMGSHFATVDHILTLTKECSKDKHLLTMTDLKPEDKMNFKSVEKICSPKVQELLGQIPDTEATIEFLKIMNYILTSFLDKEMNIEERIYKIWYSVFFLRIWKSWLRKKNNFLSTNCYNCIELNARSLILLIIQFRDNKLLQKEMFTIWNFSSQTCEKFFRATRSLTSTYSTVVNFLDYIE